MRKRVVAGSRKGHREKAAGSSNPMAGRGPSHGHCKQLGMKKYMDLCWFCMTFDLSHN